MPDQKISQLSDGGTSQATDEYVIARSGANYRIDGASIAAAATSVGTLSSLTVSGDLTVDTSTLYVDAANNRVGVGTASPSDKLAVVGASGDGISYTDSTRKVLLGTSSGLGGGYVGTTTNDAFLFLTNGSERMRLDASGNLGVGATTVSSTLGRNITINGAFAGTNSGIVLQSNAIERGYVYASDTQVVAGSSTSIPLVLLTNGTERARITSGGYFKASQAGTYANSAAYHELRVDGSAADWTVNVSSISATAGNSYGILVSYPNSTPNGTSNEFFLCFDATATRAAIRSNGGFANYQANDVNLSDERVKTDIKPVGSYWDKLKAIEIVTFKYKDQTHDDDNIGVIAQQVEAVAPEFIDVDGFGETPEDGIPLKTVYTTDMYHAAIKALQEAMARIESLEARLAALESK